MPKLIDLTGQTFNRLTVIHRVKNNKHGKACWECKCKCGTVTIVPTGAIKSGRTKSCGCLKDELLIKRNVTHGMAYSLEYGIWAAIIKRCTNPRTQNFKHYGGRGIAVCNEWRNDFMAFYNHVGRRPSAKYSIDRIKNDGNYEPGNVRWTTQDVQTNNSRKNHNITIYGWTLSLSNWARFVGLKRTTLSNRINIRNWPLAKAIFTPIKHQ